MNTIKLYALGALSMAMIACGENKETTEEKNDVEAKTKECVLTHEAGASEVNWTAFKLTEKVGVNGVFDSVAVANTNAAASVEEVMTGASFEIYTTSVNSKDSVRDWKLANKFFGIMNMPEVISGEIKSLSGGSGEVALKMNDSTILTPVSYVIKDETRMVLTTTINVPDWGLGAQNALDSLGNVCAAKHTGEDGIKKLWPDVEVKVITDLTKDCQ